MSGRLAEEIPELISHLKAVLKQGRQRPCFFYGGQCPSYTAGKTPAPQLLVLADGWKLTADRSKKESHEGFPDLRTG